MGALSEIYVDPSIAADSGTGTVGDPFGDVEYAIEQTTFDATNGTRVNIKAGTDEILAAKLDTAMAATSVSIAWAPTDLAPCVFQGYTAAADDGGIGGLDGNGASSIYDNVVHNGIWFIDLHCHNTGANTIINMNDRGGVVHCEINNSGVNGVECDLGCLIFNNFIHDINGHGVTVGSIGTVVMNNFIQDDGAAIMTSAITLALGSIAIANTCNMKSGSGGVGISGVAYTHIIGNSVYSNSKLAGSGITLAANQAGGLLMNNTVQGFSIGMAIGAANVGVGCYGGNAVFDSTTEYPTIGGHIKKNFGDNEILTVSPFADAAAGDFNGVDTGNMKEGALPAAFYEG